MTTEIIPKFDYTGLTPETSASLKNRAEKIGERNRRIAADIWENGRDLHQAQQELAQHGYGRFQEWVETETPYSLRTAYRFIDVYQQFDYAKLAQSNIAASALYLLAAPSIPDDARQEIIDAAQQGQKITYTQAKETIQAHTRPNPYQDRLQRDEAAQGHAPIKTETLRSHIVKFIPDWHDHRDQTFAQIENPAHTNGTFWRDLTNHLDRQGIPYNEPTLKYMIKQVHSERRIQPEPENTLKQAIADLVAECVTTWRAWLKTQPGPRQPYLDHHLRYVSEWDPDKKYTMTILNQAHAILEAEHQAHPTATDANYTPIPQLQHLLHQWLIYATGGRDRQEHHHWLRQCKAQGKNGEYFTDLQGWLDNDRTIYRKNDLWQALNNHAEDLRQQLHQTAEYTQEDLHRDMGTAPQTAEPLGPAQGEDEAAPYPSSSPQLIAGRLQATATDHLKGIETFIHLPKRNDPQPVDELAADDPRLHQLRQIIQDIQAIITAIPDIDGSFDDNRLHVTLSRAITTLNAAISILKTS